MRIIGGIFKGRSISFLKNSNTRPLKDSVRENIFNILNHSKFIKIDIKNANVLDLYSGIGSFGIECISQGAKKITYIEQDTKAVSLLKKNLVKFFITEKSKIYLNKIESVLKKNINEKFHILFLDPPFKDYNFLYNLELIKEKKIFSKNHIVIIHREQKSKDKMEHLLEIIKSKKYGRSRIIFGVFK